MFNVTNPPVMVNALATEAMIKHCGPILLFILLYLKQDLVTNGNLQSSSDI